MFRKPEVLVITTDTPSEGKVIKHLQPVTAHVVAGTNLFSDFFAGMSDIFGGRSGSYKKQLSSIYSEAIDRVRQEAKNIGANGVVGLKIDIDEISGQGKSMFMITAIGTAVIIEIDVDKSAQRLEKSIINGRVSNDSIKHLRYLKNLLLKAENDKLNFTSETWEFIVQNKVKEMYPFIIKKLNILLANPSSHVQQKIDDFSLNTTNFFNHLDIEDQIELIYRTLLKSETDFNLSRFLTDYIKSQELFHFESVSELLKSDHLNVKKRGLLISTLDSPYYSLNEEARLKDLSDQIEEAFKERGSTTTKKGFLATKEKEAWECECGKINNSEYTYCTKCQNDIYGFQDQELKPNAAILDIKLKRDLINEALQQLN